MRFHHYLSTYVNYLLSQIDVWISVIISFGLVILHNFGVTDQEVGWFIYFYSSQFYINVIYWTPPWRSNIDEPTTLQNGRSASQVSGNERRNISQLLLILFYNLTWRKEFTDDLKIVRYFLLDFSLNPWNVFGFPELSDDKRSLQFLTSLSCLLIAVVQRRQRLTKNESKSILSQVSQSSAMTWHTLPVILDYKILVACCVYLCLL